MKEYKIGDTVTIISREEMIKLENQLYGFLDLVLSPEERELKDIGLIADMYDYCGHKAIIRGFTDTNNGIRLAFIKDDTNNNRSIRIRLVDNKWIWHPLLFEETTDKKNKRRKKLEKIW